MSGNKNYCMIYVPTGSVEEARKIGKALVEERRAACANILPGTHSIYRWEGAVREEEEVLLLLKTRREDADDVIERVEALHSYSCPCAVALPIEAGNEKYLQWVESETEKKPLTN